MREERGVEKKIRITVLRAEYYEDLAQKYAVENLGKCPWHREGQVMYSDGVHAPEGMCEYAWGAMAQLAGQLAAGELVQPSGTWLKDDEQAVVACVDGIRPVVFLLEIAR